MKIILMMLALMFITTSCASHSADEGMQTSPFAEMDTCRNMARELIDQSNIANSKIEKLDDLTLWDASKDRSPFGELVARRRKSLHGSIHGDLLSNSNKIMTEMYDDSTGEMKKFADRCFAEGEFLADALYVKLENTNEIAAKEYAKRVEPYGNFRTILLMQVLNGDPSLPIKKPISK
jgi:hypothetical protein